MEMTGGLDNSERESGTQRVRGLGKKLETTRSLRDCGSLTASLSLLSPSLPLCSSLKHLHASTSVTSVTFELVSQVQCGLQVIGQCSVSFIFWLNSNILELS